MGRFLPVWSFQRTTPTSIIPSFFLVSEKLCFTISSLMQNRHSKGSAKDADDPDMEDKRPKSSSRGSSDYTTLSKQNKDKELGLTPRKRKREKQPNSMDRDMKRVKKATYTKFLNHEIQTEVQARGSVRRDMKSSSRRGATGRQGGGRKKMLKKSSKIIK